MASRVDICNTALSYLGLGSDVLVANTSADLKDASEPARACLLIYDSCRRQLLEMGRWSFARKIVSLALIADTDPLDNYRFQYAFPSDVLKILELRGQNGMSLWQNTPLIEIDLFVNKRDKFVIGSNLENAELDYIFNLTDTERFSPLFQEALACKIGEKLALRLTKDMKKKQQLENDFHIALSEALKQDMNQTKRKVKVSYDYLSIR